MTSIIAREECEEVEVAVHVVTMSLHKMLHRVLGPNLATFGCIVGLAGCSGIDEAPSPEPLSRFLEEQPSVYEAQTLDIPQQDAPRHAALSELSPTPCTPMQTDVYFGFGSKEDELEEQLRNRLKILTFALAPTLRLEGHADRAGGDSPNERLSDQRVVMIATKLQQLGLQNGFIGTEAHGERHPRIKPEIDGLRCLANRRVTLSTVCGPQTVPPSIQSVALVDKC